MAREFWRRENSAHWLEFWMGIWEGDAAAQSAVLVLKQEHHCLLSPSEVPVWLLSLTCWPVLPPLCAYYIWGSLRALTKITLLTFPPHLPLSFLLHPNSLLFPANSHLSSFIHIGFSTQSCNIFVHYEFHEETLLLLCSLSNPSICV